MDSKFIGFSKTVQGLVVAAIPTVMQLLGVEWGPEDTAQTADIMYQAIQLAGLAWAFYGRVEAKQSLRLKP